MHLMHHPIQAERQETKYAEDHTIEFIQTTALSQQTMRGLVKANQQSVHEMGGHQHERQRQPKPASPDHPPERDFGESEREHKGLECDAAHVTLFLPFQFVRTAVRLSGTRQMFSTTVLNKRPSSSISGCEKRFSRNSQTTSSASPSSVISHPRSNRGVPVERILSLTESPRISTSGTGWFCKANRTSKMGLCFGVGRSPIARTSSVNGIAFANESTVDW